MISVFNLCEGGPKLRKWYGAPELLPKDGTNVEEDDEFPGDVMAYIAILCMFMVMLYWAFFIKGL